MGRTYGPKCFVESVTDEVFIGYVKDSKSYADVCAKFGVRKGGSNSEYIKKKIVKLGLDISHFIDVNIFLAASRGWNKKKIDEVLSLYPITVRRRPEYLQIYRALAAIGVEYKCVGCGNKGMWQGRQLQLLFYHKNRDWRDNRRENLEWRCANCYQQSRASMNKSCVELICA